jgi:cytochrome c oxidase accessory protein FixG
VPTRGDCIDCGLCVATCPTGIDIRHGLQMECIGCAQCIDACDAVMARIGRPRGLIRYSSQAAMESGRSRLMRPRVVAYPLLLAVAVGLFGFTLAGRASADVTFLRNRSQPYRLTEQGTVANVLTVKITNRSRAPRTFDLRVLETDHYRSADTPLRLGPGESGIGVLHVDLPRASFERGRAVVTVRVSDDAGFAEDHTQHVLGPLFGAAPASGAAS